MEEIRTASHIGLWIGLIAIIGFLTWSAVNKKSETDNYAKGATHIESHYTNWPLSFGCTPVDVMEAIKPKPEAKK